MMTTNADIISPISSDVVAFLETLGSPLSTLEVGTETQPMPSNVSHPFTSAELPVTIFLTYVSEDNKFKDRIERVLSTLKRQNYSIDWKSYDVNRATELFTAIKKPFTAYELFLFLLSPGFVDHPLCYNNEVSKLIEKHQNGVWVSPILTDICLWKRTPFWRENSPLPVLPHPQQPIAKWRNRNDAYMVIAEGIITAIEHLKDGRI